MDKKTTKRLGAGLGLLTAGVLSIGAVTSGAWFTDSKESTPVVTDTGTLSAALSGSGFSSTTNQVTRNLASSNPIQIQNMAPGDTVEGRLRITNTGSLDAKYRLRAVEGDSTHADLFEQVDVAVRPAGVRNGQPTCASNVQPAVYEGRLSALDRVMDEEFIVAEADHWCFTFELDDQTGNDFQGKSSSFKVVADLTQPTNPGWTQTTAP